MLEKNLHPVYENWILNSQSDAWIIKTCDKATRGLPDIHTTVCERSVWIELKHKHKLSALQLATLYKIRNAGGIALVGKDYQVCNPVDFDMESQTIPEGKGWDIKETSLSDVIKGYHEI